MATAVWRISPVRASASLMSVRMPLIGMGRVSRPTVRWNSSGIGGFQIFSWWS